MNTRGHNAFGKWWRTVVWLGGLLLALALAACGQNKGQIAGRMYVPPGLRGTAQWGSVWLIRQSDQTRHDLAEHERLLKLALFNKEVAFLRAQKDAILQLGAVRAKIEALNRGEIPVQTILPRSVTITPLTRVDSLIAKVKVRTRPATAPELATKVARMKQALKDSAVAIRRRMQSAIDELRRQRAEQKDFLLADADAIAKRRLLRTTIVRMDGHFFFNDVPVGTYDLYGRYDLMKWFVLTPVTVRPGVVRQDISRPAGIILESKAVVSIDALVTQIKQM